MITDECETIELRHQGNDPGAVKHGNFMNYYTFHSVEERINNLHCNMFPKTSDKTILCLDIGCNSGDLTNKLFDYMTTLYTNYEVHILAIDIDPILIERAVETKNPNITFARADVMVDKDQDVIHSYLKKFNRTSFDIIFCFSVTMWIHLNNGDEGLTEFLKYIRDHCNTIIMESQPWNCYKNAQRRMKRSGNIFPMYENLKIRSDVTSHIEDTITRCNFKKLYESSNSSWNRRIQSYTKIRCK